MPVPDSLLRDASVVGPLGSLALSLVRPGAAPIGLRALRWHEGLERLGVIVPLFLAHDVGCLFAIPSEQYEVGPRVDLAFLQQRRPNLPALLDGYRSILKDVGESEAARRAGHLRLSDDLVIAVLARILGPVATRVSVNPAYRPRVPVDAAIFERLDEQLQAMFTSVDRAFEQSALEALQVAKLFVLTMSDALDADTLQLFGLVGSEASSGALSHVDLLAAFASPEANDIVNFSLEILPSVLETKTRPAAGTTAAFGYGGIGTRGSIDSLVLSELAWDDLELARRLADNEVLYYAREQSKDEQRRTHYLLVDASASMRGERTTFARGMALAMGKRLLLTGEDVAIRFFDSKLYELQRAKGGHLPTAYILSFKGERGRNPARVFAELATDLEIARRREARSFVVHVFTHAALYIPKELVQAVRAQAHVAAVFMLPSGGKLDLDYLDVLDAHWVVDHATLTKKEARSEAARGILDDTAGMTQQIADLGAHAPKGAASPGAASSGPPSVGPRSQAPRSLRSGPPSHRPPPSRRPT
jgi:hypothetical protein